MKTFTLLMAALFAVFSNNHAQTGACEVISVNTEFISSKPSVNYPGKCDITINLSWEQEINNGNTFAYVHLWQAASYQPFTFTGPSNTPMASNLSNTLGTVIIKNPSTAPALFGVYNPDISYTKVLPLNGSIPVILRKVTVGTTDRFTLENLVLEGLVCNSNSIYELMATVWASQANHGKNVHCSSAGNYFAVNKIIDNSALNCSSRTLLPSFSSSSPQFAASYKVYVDYANYGDFDPTQDLALTGELSFQTSSAPMTSGSFQYTYIGTEITIPLVYQNNSLWVELIAVDGQSSQVFELRNGCSILPVTLSEFTAVRTKSIVNLQWQTLSELNCKGFELQRRTKNNWETILFINSKANGGNSNEKISYQHSDVNNFEGVSQYRLQQISLDGKKSYSEIRMIKGEDLKSKIVLYPNPSMTGSATIITETTSAKQIMIYDGLGRMIKQINHQGENAINISNLTSGLYNIQILDIETKIVSQERLIVQRK